MPVRHRRAFRRNRRHAARSARRPKRNFVRKRRNNRKGPSTAKESAIMKDRTFVKFKYVNLTQGKFAAATGGGNNVTGWGMIPIGLSNVVSPTNAAMWVYAPQYNYTAGTPTVLTGMRILPGNSLGLYNSSISTGTAYYADSFAQALPTGASEWNTFYANYFCHGSAVEVTLLNCQSPGQLVILPITLDKLINGTTATPYDIPGSLAQGSVNLESLLNFTVLPDDQPYAKIRMVSSSGGMDRIKMKHSMMTRKLYDVKKITDQTANGGVLVATEVVNTVSGVDPTQNMWSWFIAYIPVNGIADSAGNASAVVTIQVKITYFCELVNRNQVAYAT